MTGPLVVVVGDVMNDVIVRPLGPPAPATDTPSRIARSPGGSGANQAAWLGSLGVTVRFVGRVGAADAGYHRSALEEWGVDAWLAEDVDQPTGTVVAMVAADGERSMFTDRGANVAPASTPVATEVLDGAHLLHVSGYQLFLESTRRSLKPLWEAAVGAGVPVSVDPASVAGLDQLGADRFLEMTAGATILLPNVDEARLLTGLYEPTAIVERLLDRYPVVTLKLGAGGAVAAARADGGQQLRLPAEARVVVDSTGAGDAFCAGFIAVWLAGAALSDCLAGALALAGRAVAQVGARPEI